MKKLLMPLLITTGLLVGCQSMGDHFNCMAEVDRTVPAQTQQRYIRTDTKCNSSSSGLVTPTTTQGSQYMAMGSGETNCTSTPIYQTIVLNQPQRDAAYQQCRSGINGQRASVQMNTQENERHSSKSFDCNQYANTQSGSYKRNFEQCMARGN